MVKPTFVGLGAQKCASSWIYRILEDHPDVFVSQPKELDFFTHHFNRGYTWYERNFERAGPAKIVGEISPSYFCDRLAPERIHSYDSRMKIIVALRDPVARAFSNHLHEIRKGHFRGPDLRFEAGLGSNPMYLFQSRYGTHMTNWLSFFPRSNVLILVQEEIQMDPLSHARQVYRFLNVNPEHRSEFLFRRSHESVGVRMAALFKAWRMIGDFGRRQRLDALVRITKGIPPIAAIMAANRRDLRRMVPPMRRETELALQRELAPELLTLAELLERSNWPWPTWRAALGSTMAEDHEHHKNQHRIEQVSEDTCRART